MYYIRDYYVQMAMDDSGAEVNVFYMPVLTDGRKKKIFCGKYSQ